MKKLFLFSVLTLAASLAMADVVPTGDSNNTLYYKIGGASDLALPPVQSNQTINLDANADIGAGNSCGAFNPALSITNSFNEIKDSVDNIEQGILNSATGSLAAMPMYILAKVNPTAYNLINNKLLSIHKQIDISTKTCEQAKDEIAKGQNPYKDWADISVGSSWKKHLSLTATGGEDINEAKKEIDQHAGDDGVPWVQGNKDGNTNYAGGKSQPPIHVIADSVKAGYNAILMRDSNDNSSAPQNSELAQLFPTPNDAIAWITNVVGDQTITTCTDDSCKKNQGGISGRGLLPWITTCSAQNKAYCTETIRTSLANLVTNQTPVTKENLEAVSASGIVISPHVLNAIRNMDSTQQGIIVSKLAQEVATQKVIVRALLARNILQTGSQVPVIASNKPAQTIIHNAINQLDKDMQSIAFESNIRKSMMSSTVSDILGYQANQESAAMRVAPVVPNAPLMQDSAIKKGAE